MIFLRSSFEGYLRITIDKKWAEVYPEEVIIGGMQCLISCCMEMISRERICIFAFGFTVGLK